MDPNAAMATPDNNILTNSANQLLVDLGLTNLPEDKKAELLGRIMEVLDEEIMYAVLTRLEDSDVQELEQRLSPSDDQTRLTQEAINFLQERIPNLQNVVQEAVVALYDRLKETNDILASDQAY